MERQFEVGDRVRLAAGNGERFGLPEGIEGTVREVGDGNLRADEAAARAWRAKYPYEVEWDGEDYAVWYYKHPYTGAQLYDRVNGDELEPVE